MTGSVEITAKPLAITGLTASPKVYEGTPAATLGGAAALPAPEAAGAGTAGDGKPYTVDTLTLGGMAAGTFADGNVGTAKPVTVTGLTLTGTGSGNYTLTPPAGLTADINGKLYVRVPAQ
ncbi:MAG: YDG domain-containing protein [Verrucomicrobia bacterium]|nr:YDG domain-containing protein [Verrucomicrobiota bacterium]